MLHLKVKSSSWEEGYSLFKPSFLSSVVRAGIFKYLFLSLALGLAIFYFKGEKCHAALIRIRLFCYPNVDIGQLQKNILSLCQMFSSAEYIEMTSVSSCFFPEIESVGMILRIRIVASQENLYSTQ